MEILSEISCPKCKSKNIAEILYGYNNMTSEIIQQIKVGKMKLGGCEVCNDSLKWHCNDCGTEFGSDGSTCAENK